MLLLSPINLAHHRSAVAPLLHSYCSAVAPPMSLCCRSAVAPLLHRYRSNVAMLLSLLLLLRSRTAIAPLSLRCCAIVELLSLRPREGINNSKLNCCCSTVTIYVRLYWILELIVFTILYVGGKYSRLVYNWYKNIFHAFAVLILFHAANEKTGRKQD